MSFYIMYSNNENIKYRKNAAFPSGEDGTLLVISHSLTCYIVEDSLLKIVSFCYPSVMFAYTVKHLFLKK